MEQTWRWYGDRDSVTLQDIRQAGATGIVTALHHISNGEVWPVDEILKRKQIIEDAGLLWSVVESVPVHEEIKTRSGNFVTCIENYKQSLINLAECGIDTVCYNFMPVLDWTRTDLSYELADGSRVLRFDQVNFAAFDLYILCRVAAKNEYSKEEQDEARFRFEQMTTEEVAKLTSNIIAGLAGSEESYTIEQFKENLDAYTDISKDTLRKNMALFLNELMPVCEGYGLRLAVHPDDPPRPIFGLPRIVSTVEDMDWLVKNVPSKMNGFTMCTGSYGVREDNDLVRMINSHSDRIYFAHLRSTQRDSTNSQSFHEAAHLEGDVDMYEVVKALLTEEQARSKNGDLRLIPMRPDHGHQILDDLKKPNMNGYSAIGRLKGLAEVRGLEVGLKRAIFNK